MKKTVLVLTIAAILLSVVALSGCSGDSKGTLIGIWVLFSDDTNGGDPSSDDVLFDSSVTIFQSYDEDDATKKVANAHEDFKNVVENWEANPSEISAEITATKKFVRIVPVYKRRNGKVLLDLKSVNYIEVTETRTEIIEDTMKGDAINKFIIKVVK